MMTKNKPIIEVGEIIQQKDLAIETIYNEKWITNKIQHPRTQKPGLAIAGYLKYLNKKRVQIFGKTEIGYLYQIKEEKREARLKNYLSSKVPCIVISENQEIDEYFIRTAEKNKTPILISKLRTSLLVSRISNFLYRHFSDKIRINGVLIDIMGQGILITGKSGIGKSEIALELLNKGHHLISDDLIEFFTNANDEPIGRSVEPIKNWLEVRGLGIINIAEIFGIGAMLEEKKLDLVINLEDWNPKKKYDRLGVHNKYFKILGKDIPMFVLPVSSGRNLSTLIEVSVKFFKAKLNGSTSFIDALYRKEKQ